jgi:hypothetical protein
MNRTWSNRAWFALLLFASVMSSALTSCSVTNMSPRLSVFRVGDTLQVDLDEETSARWSSTRDSLVINCENCEVGYTRLVEKFEEDNRAAVYISPYERLRLSLYSNDLDTVIIVEPLFVDSLPRTEPRRIVRAAPRRRAPVQANQRKQTAQKPETPPARNNTTVKKEEKVEKKEAAPVKKRATTARVTANEGVAIYKDKSKREVLKILPKGSAVPYIAKEGELTSVMVDGQEGFVESEAVKIED